MVVEFNRVIEKLLTGLMTFAGNKNDVAGERILHSEGNRLGTIGDDAMIFATDAGFNFAQNCKWVFRARIVRSQHTGIAVTRGRGGHERPLAAIAIAAAEAAVGLALVIAVHRHQRNIRLQEANHLRG